MLVKEMMTQVVEAAQPSESVQQLAKQMKERNIGSIPICNDQKEVIGMVTDRDIALRVVAEGRDLTVTEARGIMSTEVATCSEDQDLRECIRLMQDRGVRRIPVLNRDGRLVGLISLDDLAAHAEQVPEVSETMQRIATAEQARAA